MRLLFYLLPAIFFACSTPQKQQENDIMTVRGPIDNAEMGMTLEHEHIVVDFIGAEIIKQPQYPVQIAMDSLLPYFMDLKSLGIQTFIDCTPNYIGRDVNLLKKVSIRTGLNIITNTGYYAAAEKKYLPAHAYTETAEQLAGRWIAEWENGIDGTGIRPGFIKLGVGRESLDSIEQKIVRAGAIAHLATGLKIAIHTGGYAAANDEIAILKQLGVHPRSLIVVHAQSATTDEQMLLGHQGAWISLDGINDSAGAIEKYIELLKNLKKEGLLGQVLISQDAYWQVIRDESAGIRFERHGSPYTAIFEKLIPKLLDRGFTQEDIDQLLVKNPARAFGIEICKY
jgi:phosphotriesterase-related protein